MRTIDKKPTQQGYAKVLVMVGLKYKLFTIFKYANNPANNESPFEELLEKRLTAMHRWI